MQDNLSRVIRLVTIVSLAVLLVNGHALYASISLGYMVVTALPCVHTLSQHIPYLVQLAGIVNCFGGLILGSWSERIALVGMRAIPFIAHRFLRMPERAPIEEVDEKEAKAAQETKEVFENLDNGQVVFFNAEGVRIRPEVIKREVLPPRPMNIDLHQLVTWFGEMGSKEFESSLAEFFDEEFQDEDPSEIAQAQEKVQEWVKAFDKTKPSYLDRLNGLIEDVTKPKPEQPIVEADRKRMLYYLRYICSRLADVDKGTKYVCLIAIALSNGDKTPSAQFTGIADVFYKLLEKDKSLPLKEQILVHMQRDRQKRFDKELAKKIQEIPLPHSMLLHSALCESLGLRRNVIYIPCQNGYEKIVSSIWNFSGKSAMDSDSHNINEAFYDKDGMCVLDKTQIIEWWYQWIERQDDAKSPAKRERLREVLDQGRLVWRPLILDKDPNKLDPHFMAAMLYQMGLVS